MRTFEYTPASELMPGDAVLLNPGEAPIILTVVRHNYGAGGTPTVSLYREPTREEYSAHFEDHEQDLRAVWISTSVGWFPILKGVPPQTGDLAY